MLSPSPELFKLIDSSRKDKLTKCCVFGSFLSGSHGNAWVTVNQAIALLIKDYGDFTFRFSIVNESGQSIYTKLVNVDLNYVIEEKEMLFKWVDTMHDIKLYAVQFHEANDVVKVKFLLAKCLFEASHRENFQDVVKKEEQDWAERYFEDRQEKEIVEEFREGKTSNQYQKLNNRSFIFQIEK
jgi:hypothetical protein